MSPSGASRLPLPRQSSTSPMAEPGSGLLDPLPLVVVNPFFDDLGARFAAAGERRGIAIDAPQLSPAVAGELLELARVAAHTQERRFAPLASYLAGVFAERVAAAGGPADPYAVAAVIREVREELEREAAGRTD